MRYLNNDILDYIKKYSEGKNVVNKKLIEICNYVLNQNCKGHNYD